jgi:hypothetical protein
MTITSLDFETANPSRVSICAAGFTETGFVPWLDACSETAHNNKAEPVHLAATK